MIKAFKCLNASGHTHIFEQILEATFGTNPSHEVIKNARGPIILLHYKEVMPCLKTF